METDYNFWRDLLDTYQSLDDWLKLCWLVIPSGLLLIAGNGLSNMIQRALAPEVPEAPPPLAAAAHKKYATIGLAHILCLIGVSIWSSINSVTLIDQGVSRENKQTADGWCVGPDDHPGLGAGKDFLCAGLEI